MRHDCCICSINEISEKVSMTYKTYREENQILCNYLMSHFTDWQVYMTEHDVNVFRLNFCYEKDRTKDATFLLTREQLENIKCVLEEIIIPTLVHIEEECCECCHN